jgi:CHAD domain-containing protein
VPRPKAVTAEQPVAVVARLRIGTQLARLRREMREARAGKVEGVHQLRVATRRLRALFRLFGSTFPRATVDRVDDDLQWLGQTVGPVRDLDVLAAALAGRARRLRAGRDPSLAPLLRHLDERRRTAHAVLVDALDGPRARRLAVQVAALATSTPPASAPCRAVAAGLVRPLVRAVDRAARRARDDASPETLHRLRVRVKRLRYALEGLDGAGGGETRRLARRLEKLQDRLGDYHDAVAQHEFLRQEATTVAGEPETLLALGTVIEYLRRRARKLVRRIPARCDRALRAKVVQAALGELAAEAEAA